MWANFSTCAGSDGTELDSRQAGTLVKRVPGGGEGGGPCSRKRRRGGGPWHGVIWFVYWKLDFQLVCKTEINSGAQRSRSPVTGRRKWSNDVHTPMMAMPVMMMMGAEWPLALVFVCKNNVKVPLHRLSLTISLREWRSHRFIIIFCSALTPLCTLIKLSEFRGW